MHGKKKFLLGTMICVLVFLVLYTKDRRKILDIYNPSQINEFQNAIIYFGRDSCLNCELADKVIRKIENKEKFRIYYFDTDKWRGEDCFEEILRQYQITEVPVLIKIVNQKYIDRLEMVDKDGKINIKNVKNFFEEDCV